MGFILSVRAGHNASACIGEGGKIRHAVQEERLNGEKNYWGFPKLALRHCMAAVGASARDLDAVVSGERMILNRYHSRDDLLETYRRFFTTTGRLRQRVAIPIALAFKPDYGQKEYKESLAGEGLGQVPVQFYDHHQGHAATAYYGLRKNPKDRYLVLTCDGAGDRQCTTLRVMGGGEDHVIAATPWEHSLGAIYSWVTYAMGFVPLEHEYKLMGMAPYAPEKAAIEAAKMFEAYLGLDATGLRFERRARLVTDNFIPEIMTDMQGKRFDYLCAGLQKFTEDLLVSWTRNAVKKTGIRKVLAAGGVFMNVKANQKIAELAEVESFEAFPSCGDETLSLGGFYLESAARLGDAAVEPLQNFYLGDDISDAEAEAELASSGFSVEKPEDLPGAVAGILAAGEPMARARGPMEFGARALGNRSILADPSNQDVVRVINRMVKKRDFWMPFAPMMLARRANDYIKNPKDLRSPYMMMTFDTRENFKELIAAVHNADLTCRAQLLDAQQNPEMNAILEAYEKKTGRGVILNTSYNLHGFPICRTAKDSLHVFKESGLEVINLGSFIVRKRAKA
jgi:carbamoyltransferase